MQMNVLFPVSTFNKTKKATEMIYEIMQTNVFTRVNSMIIRERNTEENIDRFCFMKQLILEFRNNKRNINQWRDVSSR